MGEGLGDALIKPITIYLDTHIVLWMAQGELGRISSETVSLMENADLRVSPIVLLELQYLFEIGRTELQSRAIMLKVESELNIRVCNFPFALTANCAVDENWTRDPFDRIIVAHAKANGLSILVPADEEIAEHYPRTAC
jgi:PIN domain nuclease of toxin-antitoxin system